MHVSCTNLGSSEWSELLELERRGTAALSASLGAKLLALAVLREELEDLLLLM